MNEHRHNYKCELVHNGIVQERIWREGTNKEEVKAGLEMFQWPHGEWRITFDIPTDLLFFE